MGPISGSLFQSQSLRQDKELPRIVLGVTHPQCCLTLTGRIRAFREAGFEVYLVSSPGEIMQRTAAEEGAIPVEIPMERQISPWGDLNAFIRLVLLLLKLKPKITEFGSPKAGLLGSVAAFLCRVPVRVYLLKGLKLETSRGSKFRILLGAERLAAACSHAVLCNSSSLRQLALLYRVAPEQKLCLLGQGSSNGVNLQRFRPALKKTPRAVPATRAQVIGYVGRLTKDKGIPELLAAFDRIHALRPSVSLLLVGWFDQAEDSLDLAIQEQIQKHPGIRMTGFVRDTAPYYQQMDLLVLPSYREGFPNVVLEAAASALPVVTTKATGARDSVRPDRTGLLVTPGNVNELTKALWRLLQNPSHCQQMGRVARTWVEEEFADRSVLGRTVYFYRCLMMQASVMHHQQEYLYDWTVALPLGDRNSSIAS